MHYFIITKFLQFIKQNILISNKVFLILFNYSILIIQNLKTYQLTESYNYTKLKKQQQQQQLMSHHFYYDKRLPKRNSKINHITPPASVSKSVHNQEEFKRRMIKNASNPISKIGGYDYLLTKSKEKTKKKPLKVDSSSPEFSLTTIRCSRPPSRKKTFDFSKQRTVSFIDEVKHTNLCVYCD